MTDRGTKQFPDQRNQEPMTIDTTLTGNHPAGNYRGSVMEDQGRLPPPDAVADVWIEQEDQAKQGMARRFRVDPKQAEAAPDHPHIGPTKGSGESQ